MESKFNEADLRYVTANTLKTMEEYEEQVKETAIYPGVDGLAFKIDRETRKQILSGNITGLLYTALGLAGEAGEFSDKVKKILRDDKGVISLKKRLAMAQELGDVFWYLARCSAELRYTLEMISDLNYEKLSKRKKEGKLGGSGDDR